MNSPSRVTDVLVLHDEVGEHLTRLANRFADINFHACREYASLERMLDRYQPQVVFASNFEQVPFPRKILVEQPCIDWLALAFSGVDSVTPWDEGRLIVTNSAGLASAQIAQYVVGAIYGLYHRLPLFAAQQARKQWCFEWVKAAQNVRVGIVGLGHIGRAVARLCSLNGFTPIACKVHTESAEDVAEVYPATQLHDMLSTVDVAVVCTALTTSTRDLFDDTAFAAMKPGSYFINVSRGAIVKEDALLAALSTGHLAGAYLDVVCEEPLTRNSPLWNAPNCLITPHISGEFEGWFGKAIDLFAENLDLWLAGKELKNRVSSRRGY